MAHALSLSQVNELQDKALSMSNRLKRMSTEKKETMQALVSGVEFSAAAFSVGVIDGRFGGVELVGVPLSLLLAGGGHLLGVLGVASPHMHAFANGSLASYLTTLGNGIGARMAMQANKSAAPAK
jgi:hypothetical protein